ncbi:MAG: hypothetical protein Pg6C_19020 [Treponemataceae bacterium]|nr:MAG: hypothetical protein Pg6C_18690 [Treponemataceae bacterium]GMO52997.1 MAG: hypothetical protein Pg6C_19020 [Treponemataceae bacterium]
MGTVAVIYTISFFSLSLSAVLFLRRTIITDALKELRGLTFEPHCDENSNSVIVKNNFTEFYTGIPKALRFNYPLLMLKKICADIEESKNYNGAWYLSLYKKYHTGFLGRLFIASLIAPIVALITADDEYSLVPLIIALQCVVFLLFGILFLILFRNFDAFTKIFYQQWYDTLLNFDAMRTEALQGKFFEESDYLSGEELKNTLQELQNVYSLQIDFLSKAVSELASSLQQLADEKNKGEIVTIETIVNSLEANFKRIGEMCSYFESAVKTLELSYKELIDFTGADKPTISAVNNLVVEFSELRKTLSSYASASENAAIKKLDDISAALEATVDKTFTTIDSTIQRNAEYLFESYKRFFELCKTLHLTRADGEIFQ